MFRYLLIVCFISCSAFAEDVPDARIVGGRPASRGQFPYQASLRQSKTDKHICGAVIIGDRWLLTAAHCTIGKQVFNFHVVAGSIDRTTGGERYELLQIIEHPDFNEYSLENDLAILKTVNTFRMSIEVLPIKMSSSLILAGKIGTVSGWGQTSTKPESAVMLQYMEVKTLDNEDCKLRHGLRNEARVHSSSICTYAREGRGTCMGDSGSPLVVDNVLAGLVSWGIPCAAGMPDVYTRIESHRAWILTTIAF